MGAKATSEEDRARRRNMSQKMTRHGIRNDSRVEVNLWNSWRPGVVTHAGEAYFLFRGDVDKTFCVVDTVEHWRPEAKDEP